MARPLKAINWDQVKERMEAGSTAKEIAGFLDVEINTFYDRFKLEFGCGFADYADSARSSGFSQLKWIQYKKALSGNAQMLIWLGKNWLGQKDRDEEKSLSPNDSAITSLIETLKEYQASQNASQPETNPELSTSDTPL